MFNPSAGKKFLREFPWPPSVPKPCLRLRFVEDGERVQCSLQSHRSAHTVHALGHAPEGTLAAAVEVWLKRHGADVTPELLTRCRALLN